MFTGLIEEIGNVNFIRPYGGGKLLSINAKTILEDVHVDDSIAINGVCQTVVSFNHNSFEVIAVEETLQKTTLGALHSSEKVNLERAVKAETRLGGHIVQGHVDCIGIVKRIERKTTEVDLWIEFPEEYAKLIVPTGSITVQGVSLTSARVENNNSFMVAIIPHTWDNTIFSTLRNSSKVNLEFDIIGKYVNRILAK
ncbi:MAG: riboflavin synthase [Bacteroidetes bacterium 4572_77]|nr:MAG: riboflavin synthase [Bacteroidetes bacterium 4572_77]